MSGTLYSRISSLKWSFHLLSCCSGVIRSSPFLSVTGCSRNKFFLALNFTKAQKLPHPHGQCYHKAMSQQKNINKHRRHSLYFGSTQLWATKKQLTSLYFVPFPVSKNPSFSSIFLLVHLPSTSFYYILFCVSLILNVCNYHSKHVSVYYIYLHNSRLPRSLWTYFTHGTGIFLFSWNLIILFAIVPGLIFKGSTKTNLLFFIVVLKTLQTTVC